MENVMARALDEYNRLYIVCERLYRDIDVTARNIIYHRDRMRRIELRVGADSCLADPAWQNHRAYEKSEVIVLGHLLSLLSDDVDEMDAMMHDAIDKANKSANES